MSSSQASQAEVFTRLIQALIDYSNAQLAEMRGEGAGGFFDPNSGDIISLTEIEKISKLFDRKDLYKMFRKVLDDGVVGDLTAILAQGDFVASMERAYRARHQSAIRCRAHAAARHRGHGHSNGLLNSGLVSYLSSVLKQAGG